MIPDKKKEVWKNGDILELLETRQRQEARKARSRGISSDVVEDEQLEGRLADRKTALAAVELKYLAPKQE